MWVRIEVKFVPMVMMFHGWLVGWWVNGEDPVSEMKSLISWETLKTSMISLTIRIDKGLHV